MSKYNHMMSIPIDSISKKDISQAIKEWAEGDEALEKFLWACYEKGIKTSGCHAGEGPYIDFEYQEGLEGLLNITQKKRGSQIFVVADGGNPFSGPNWDKPIVSLSLDTKYQDEADTYFNNLTNTLIEDTSEKKENSLLKLLDFFIDKESTLLFRLRHTNDNQYTFNIESSTIPDNRYNYYNNIFTKAGLIEDKTTFIENDKRHDWKMESNSLDDILRRIEYATEYIINNYDLSAPISEDEILNFNSKARFKKKTLSKEEFEKWIIEMKEKFTKNKIVSQIMEIMNNSGEFSFEEINTDEKMSIIQNIQNELNAKSMNELKKMLSLYKEKNIQEKHINEKTKKN